MCMYLHATISLSLQRYTFSVKNQQIDKIFIAKHQNCNFIPFSCLRTKTFFMTAVHLKMNLYRTLS